MPIAEIRKRAEELEALIGKRIGEAHLRYVRVYPDKILGWYAVVIANPERVFDLQRRVDAIAAELRTAYELRR